MPVKKLVNGRSLKCLNFWIAKNPFRIFLFFINKKLTYQIPKVNFSKIYSKVQRVDEKISEAKFILCNFELVLIKFVSFPGRRRDRHSDTYKLGHQFHPVLRHEPTIPHNLQSAVLQPMATNRQVDGGAASTDGEQRTHWDQSHGDPGHPGLASKKSDLLLSGIKSSLINFFLDTCIASPRK